MNNVLKKQQEAAGIKTQKTKVTKQKDQITELEDESILFSLTQNLKRIQDDDIPTIYEESFKQMRNLFNNKTSQPCKIENLMENECNKSDVQIQCFNCGDRTFFYALGNLVSNRLKFKPFLSVFEYFSKENTFKSIHEVLLNNKWLRIQPKHR